MGYFPNGTAGEIFASENCAHCANADDEGFCPIWDVHLIYNRTQFEDGQAALKHAMALLIDDDSECKLFRASS